MRLSEMRGRSQQPAYEQHDQTDVGTVRSAVAYQRPIGALYQGRPVTLIATGDIAGMSPAEKFVDENGRIDWASSDEFTVNDPQVVPLSSEQRNRLNSGRAATQSR